MSDTCVCGCGYFISKMHSGNESQAKQTNMQQAKKIELIHFLSRHTRAHTHHIEICFAFYLIQMILNQNFEISHSRISRPSRRSRFTHSRHRHRFYFFFSCPLTALTHAPLSFLHIQVYRPRWNMRSIHLVHSHTQTHIEIGHQMHSAFGAALALV